MNFSNKGIPSGDSDTKLSLASRATTLNPHAAEFVPFSLRLSSGSSSAADATAKPHASGALGKAVLDRSESSISNKSDEEAHRYWHHQLPDDITPDFKVMGENESQGPGDLSLSGLSLNDGSEASRIPASIGSRYMSTEHEEFSPSHINGIGLAEKLRYSIPPYGEDSLNASLLHSPSKLWDEHSDQLLSDNQDAFFYNGKSRPGFLNDTLSEHAMVENSNINPLEYLASQFPGFAIESLADVYMTNGCDLNLTIEMLTQLELQVDGSFSQNLSPKTLSAPNLSTMDFPALPVGDSQNVLQKYARDDLQESFSFYRSGDKDKTLMFKTSPPFPSRSAVDFASIVKKPPQDSGIWKVDKNCSSDASIGPSRSSHYLTSSYSTNGRGIYRDKLQSRNSARVAPTWLETGDAVANMYTELREEARDYARLRNAYFEQARQAYLIGNKALAKELSIKGQVHNMRMKEAHEKAQETIYRQRNPMGLQMQGNNGRGQEKMIDLHGLHVNEAIHVLKQELNLMRSMARPTEQCRLVYVCVGTGHHTRGSRTPARLPVAVQHYLLEEEGLDYTEPQPGLLRVVM